MQGNRVVAKLNDLNHHREQSTEISSVGFSDPLNSFVLTDFDTPNKSKVIPL